MESRAKLFGHPVHPILIVFPVGLFVTSFGFDIAYFLTGSPRWADISFSMIGVGIITGLVAAVFGFIDWLAIPALTRAKAIGAWHGAGNVVVVTLFALSWWSRYENPLFPGYSALLFSLAGVALLMVTGWLGGELVDRLGVGVDDGANVNAPSSFTTHQIAGGFSR